MKLRKLGDCEIGGSRGMVRQMSNYGEVARGSTAGQCFTCELSLIDSTQIQRRTWKRHFSLVDRCKQFCMLSRHCSFNSLKRITSGLKSDVLEEEYEIQASPPIFGTIRPAPAGAHQPIKEI